MKRRTISRRLRRANNSNYLPTFSGINDFLDGRTLGMVALIGFYLAVSTPKVMDTLQHDGWAATMAGSVATCLSTRTFTIVLTLSLAFSAALVAALFWMGDLGAPRWLHGKKGYRREDPVPGIHPVVVSRVWNGFALVDDVVVGLLKLADDKAIGIRRTRTDGNADRKHKRNSDETDFAVGILNLDYQPSNKLDAILFLYLMFRTDRGKHQITVANLITQVPSDGSAKHRKIRAVQESFITEFFHESRRQAVDSGLFPPSFQMHDGKQDIGPSAYRGCLSNGLFFLSMLSPLGFFFILLETHDLAFLGIPFIRWTWLLPWLVYAIILLCFDRKRSAKGQRALSTCQNLRRWLKDFTLLKDRDAGSVEVWGPYAVYAYVLDVSEQTMNDLRAVGGSVDQTVMDMVMRDTHWFTPVNDDMDCYHALVQGDTAISEKLLQLLPE